MIRKITYSITALNILFQIIYMLFGGTDKYIYVFYVFRIEYMIFSGLIAAIIACIVFTLIIIAIVKSIIERHMKNIIYYDIAILILNVEYIIYYIKFLMQQY